MKSIKILQILFLAILFVGLWACYPTGEIQEESRTVKLGEAESVEVDLNIGAGQLKLYGSARELMEGNFVYNVERWKPRIDYSISGTRGLLRIRQGKSSGVPIGKKRNRWDISLSNDVPLDLKIDFGAGEGKLDLRGLNLESLNIDMGVGSLTVDLADEWKQDLEISIDGGVGSATVYLPENVGVRVSVDKGIGSVHARDMNKEGHVYTNDAYGKTEVSINMDIEAGIGSIDLELK